MQAKRRLLPILLVLFVAVLLYAGCAGAGPQGQDRTWFNLPSVPVNVKADGAMDLYGIGLGALPAAQVQQLQSLGAENIEARVGANGIYVYLNGKDLPYVAWDAASQANLGNVLGALGTAVPVDLSLLRTIGLGAAIKLPPPEGQAAMNIPRWTGETLVTPTQPVTGTEPLNLSLISFDANGQANVAGISAETLAGLGVAVPQLTPEQMNLIKAIGLDKLTITSQPNGIDIVANGDQPWPSLAYDEQRLDSLSGLLGAVLPAEQATMVQGILPMLPKLGMNFTVGFNGQPPETTLKDIAVKVNDAGALNVLGLDIPGASLPAETLKTLQSANIQQVALNATTDSIAVAVNGQTLPKINFTADGLNVVASLVGSATGMKPEMITTGLNVLTKDGLSTNISLPPAAGATPVEATAPVEPTFAPPDLGDMKAPVLSAAVIVKDGQIASVGGLTTDQLGALGVTLPTLPPNVTDLLATLGAKEIDIVNKPNDLQISLNGTQVLSMQHDKASLEAAWNLAKPFLADSPAADPAMQQLIEQIVLPMLPGTALDVKITVE